MRWSLERLVPLAFACALALLVGVGIVSYRSTTALLEDARRVTHTHEVLSELDGALLALKDAETGQRGFLLTGVEDHLASYSAGNAAVGERLRRLRELTADNPGQRRRLDVVGPLVAARLAKLRESIDRHRAGLPPAAESLAAGKRLMDELSLRLAEMAAEELRLLGERERRSQAAAGRALAVVMLGSLLAALVTALAYLAVRRELARRRAAETKLQSFNRELERSNRELQDFAYVASHDLQEPLRKVQAFGDRMRSKYGEALGPEGRDYLERMQNAARRMAVLINDLLTFSRVSTTGQPFAPVDLNQVARDVMGDLEVRVQQTGGSVELGELPTLDADALQMRQLLQNLIGNALKFHRPGEPPAVKVGARAVGPPEGGAWPPAPDGWRELTVEDRGIGFDEKYLDRIFTPFQRLHARGEYEGTGMGLAVCRRIVERHGGQITARSAPERGTTFVVTLPAKQLAEPDS